VNIDAERRWARSCALLLAALALSGAARIAAATPSAAVTGASRPLRSWSLEAPTGRYPIGSVTLHLIDRSRWDPLAPSRRRRELMMQIWYPTVPSRVKSREAYSESGVAQILDRELGAPMGSFEAVRSHVRDGAPAARTGQRPFGVVLYSPGYGSWRNTSTALVEQLVSHGLAVVTIDHPYDGEAVEFPDGSIARARPIPLPRVTSKDPAADFPPLFVAAWNHRRSSGHRSGTGTRHDIL
jgi:hypothetical protein